MQHILKEISGKKAEIFSSAKKKRSNLMIARQFDAKKPKEGNPVAKKVWRIDGRYQFVERPLLNAKAKPLDQQSVGADDVVVINDTGNQFRNDEWRAYAAGPLKGHDGWIACAIHRPFPFSANRAGEHALWDSLNKKAFKNRSVIVVNLWDLRNAGARVTRGLSWEKTISELLTDLGKNKAISGLKAFPRVLIMIGLEGALLLENGVPTLIYDPKLRENQFGEEMNGTMLGYTNVILSSLALELFDLSSESVFSAAVIRGVSAGLAGARALLKHGFNFSGRARQKEFYPLKEISDAIKAEKEQPERTFKCRPCDGSRSILELELSNEQAVKAAELIAIYGESDAIVGEDRMSKLDLAGYADARKALLRVPLGEFGKLRTYDRHEMETLSGICNLLGEYFSASTERPSPLSIAVFGSPGSGKSFCVKEISKAIRIKLPPKTELDFLEINLAQFRSPDELVSVFHRIRDSHLNGKMPIAFFDEFDSAVGGIPLFWLKHFLAPMQDGLFLENGVYHPIGRAVFVFAGGISESFKQFSKSGGSADARRTTGRWAGGGVNIKEEADEETAQRNAKLPDFLSRLRGFIDVPGVNSVEKEPLSAAMLLRRAFQIRAQCDKRAKNLFASDVRQEISVKVAGSDGGTEKGMVANPAVLDIDPSLLKALLSVPELKHGARSIQAIIEMSSLNKTRRFDPGCLASDEQLSVHVDIAQFKTALSTTEVSG